MLLFSAPRHNASRSVCILKKCIEHKAWAHRLFKKKTIYKKIDKKIRPTFIDFFNHLVSGNQR